jgi:hypothetical protein
MTGTPAPKLCFVIMPFSKERKEVYKFGIAPACRQAGYEAKRVDELPGPFNINRKIIEYLFHCDAVVAEITDKNPNVFYEMGVAHTLGNKTIMIAQDAEKLPFDIRNYRCIIYEQSVEGLQRLQEEIVRSLREIGDWSRHPSNPVQDFKPHDAFVRQGDFDKLQKTLRQKEELLAAAQQQLREKEEQLKQAAPKSELVALQKEAAGRQAEIAVAQKQLREKDANLEQAAKRAAALQNELAQTQAEVLALQKEMQLLRQPPPPKAAPPKKLFRAQPLDGLSVDAVKKMLQEKKFFDSHYNKQGKGFSHQYEKVEHEGQPLVIDHAAGLTWQQSGSPDTMTYVDAEKYMRDLNAKKFAGYNDWRLPTLEEAMSLIEPTKKNGDLYIDPVFDRTQRWIWTADKADSAGVAWVASFYHGYCGHLRVTRVYFVRVVR